MLLVGYVRINDLSMKTYILVLCKIKVPLSCEPQQWYEVLDYINWNKIWSKLSKFLFFSLWLEVSSKFGLWKKNTKYLIECGIRLNPNSLLKPSSERCDNPEFSSRVLRFFRRFSFVISICIFLLHHELLFTVEVNLSRIPKHWEIGVFMKWAKGSLCGKSMRQAGLKKFQAENIDEAKKSDLALCFFGWYFLDLLNPFVFPGRTQDDLSRERIRVLVFAQIFLGSPWDKH